MKHSYRAIIEDWYFGCMAPIAPIIGFYWGGPYVASYNNKYREYPRLFTHVVPLAVISTLFYPIAIPIIFYNTMKHS